MADDFRISELVTLAPAALRAAVRGKGFSVSYAGTIIKYLIFKKISRLRPYNH